MATNNTDIPGSLNAKRGAAGVGNNAAPKAEAPKEKPQIKPAGKGIIVKKSLAEKFSETFVKEDLKSVGKTLLEDKIFPGIISMIRDTIWDGITMHFGLGGSRGSSSSGGKSGYVNYQAASTSSYNYRGGSANTANSTPKKKNGPQNFRDIAYETEQAANDVIATMRHYAKQYNDEVSISYLYEASQLSSNAFTDNNWGWTSEMLANVQVARRIVDGQLMYFPNWPDPVPID